MRVDTYEEVTVQLESIFNVLDVDASGEVSFDELQLGFQAFELRPRIQITEDDMLAMTQGTGKNLL